MFLDALSTSPTFIFQKMKFSINEAIHKAILVVFGKLHNIIQFIIHSLALRTIVKLCTVKISVTERAKR